MQNNKNSLLIVVYFGSLICFFLTFYLSFISKGTAFDWIMVIDLIILCVSVVLHLFCLGRMIYLYFKK